MEISVCPQCSDILNYDLENDVCNECSLQNESDKENIRNLESQGHSYNCACRQVWGDGECVCSRNNCG